MRNILASIGGAVLLAAPVFAQAEAAAALQRARLIEQQEGDLRQAEQEYRKLLQGAAGADATAVQTEAALHLGELLWRLDRRDDARPFLERARDAGGDPGARAAAVLQGQDPAGKQAQELAAKVREIVDRAIGKAEQPAPAETPELAWLGAAAVPELGRRLDAMREPGCGEMQELWHDRDAYQRHGYDVHDAAALARAVLFTSVSSASTAQPAGRAASWLWRLGGAEAATVLRRHLDDPEPWWRRLIAVASGSEVHESLLPLVEAMLRDPDPVGAVPELALRAALQLPFVAFAPLLQADRGNVRDAAWSLLSQHPVWRDSQWQATAAAEQALTLVLPAIDRVLGGSDPALARVAFGFLGTIGASSERGSELFLTWLPKVPVFTYAAGANNLHAPLASLVACAKVLGPANGIDGNDDRRRCLAGNVQAAVRKVGGAAALVLDLVDLGYDLLGNWRLASLALALDPEPADLERVAGLLDKCIGSWDLAKKLAELELPAGALSGLVHRLDALLAEVPAVGESSEAQRTPAERAAAGEAMYLLAAIGRTGNPIAIDTLRTLLRGRPDFAPHTINAAIDLAGRSDDATIGAFLRELLVDEQRSSEQRNEVFGALVARADVAAIPLYARAYQLGLGRSRVPAPMRGPGSVTRPQRSVEGYRGMGWLKAPEHDRYTEAQILLIWQSLLQGDAWLDAMVDLGSEPPRPVRLAILGTLAARLDALATQPENRDGDWRMPVIVKVLLQDVPTDDTPEARRYRAAVGALCANPWTRAAVMASLRDPAVIRLLVEQLVPQLHTSDAYAVYQVLRYGGVTVPTADVIAGLQHSTTSSFLELLPRDAAPEVVRAVEARVEDSDVGVRQVACQTMGRLLSASSAPALLTALRDSNPDVRAAATAALQQIRLYHEQKAFWDQFQTGISTGREAAAAKLLAQARPDQPKEQRLLSLRSLGVLGAPEALPYLIDWCTDQDAEVGQAARTAIENIQAAAGGK